MKRKSRHFVLFCGPVLLALALTACGPSSSVPEKPVQVHGDLITPVQPASAKTTSAPPAITAPAPTTKVAQVKATPVAPKPTVLSTPILTQPTNLPPAPEYARVGFDKLASYNFEVDDTPVTNITPATDKANTQIPAAVKALD